MCNDKKEIDPLPDSFLNERALLRRRMVYTFRGDGEESEIIYKLSCCLKKTLEHFFESDKEALEEFTDKMSPDEKEMIKKTVSMLHACSAAEHFLLESMK